MKIERVRIVDIHGNVAVDEPIAPQGASEVIEEHNENEQAHPDLRESIADAEAAAETYADGKVSTHDSDQAAHGDIRNAVAAALSTANSKVAGVKLNGVPITPVEGVVDVEVPTKVSDLQNDEDYQTEGDVKEYAVKDLVVVSRDGQTETSKVVELPNGQRVVKLDESDLGKIAAIKVNGTEQEIDEDGKVDIPVPTSVSDLEDADAYATKEDAQAMVNEAKVTGVTLDYQEDGGAPQATANFNEGSIDFTLKNMKMKFSELSNEEKEALVGPTGPQGATGLYDPSNPDTPAYTLESTIGLSETSAMTQKAVTEEFSKVAYTDETASTEGRIDFTDKYITVNGAWSSSQSGKNNGRMIPVTPGKIYKVVATTNNRLAILKSSNSTTVDFSDDYQTVIPMVQGDQYIFVAPSDAQYLYYATYMTSSATFVAIYLQKPIIEKVAAIEDEIEDVKSDNESIKESLIVKEKQTLSASYAGFVGSENTWTGIGNANWKHAVVDIKPGKHYRIESERATSINVLQSYTKPTTDGGTPDFSEEEGFTSRIIVDVSPYQYDFVAPSDAFKLVVCTQRRDSNVNYPTNTKVYETMPVNQAIEDGIGGNAKQVKMLVIGDSWGRDIATELQPAAEDMGLNLYVAQAYQGGSGLYNQYKGMDDATRHYTHGTGASAYEQYVQGTYQLWTYTSDTPVKAPSTGYNNGKCGVNDGIAYGKVSIGGTWAAKTLDEILASQDWDIIIVRLHCGELQVEDSLMASDEDEDKRYFDINDFIERMEDSLTLASKAKVKWGLATTWAYPVEAYNIDRDKIKSMLKAMELYDSWNSMNAAEKQAVFNELFTTMQANFQKVCKHLGDKLTYAVNIAKAIQEARDSEWLGSIGYHLNRSDADMHLSNGIPKYLCALTILYSIFEKSRNALKLTYIPDLADGSGTDSDGGSDNSAVTPTKALCVGAQAIAWKTACNTI